MLIADGGRSVGARVRTKPPAVLAPALISPAVDVHAFADADEAVAVPVGRRGAVAVVGDLELDVVRPVADGHVGVAGMGVLERVGQAFLHDSIGGEVDRAGQRERVAVHGAVAREGRRG